MVVEAGLPLLFRDEAVNTSCYTQTNTEGKKTGHLLFLCVWMCLLYVESNNTSARSVKIKLMKECFYVIPAYPRISGYSIFKGKLLRKKHMSSSMKTCSLMIDLITPYQFFMSLLTVLQTLFIAK
uniref:Uncharacterized protein n=1 Tax=Lactuca sativa TaxID=4236 RepID=A0A9R1XH80_LACSA|nr:hypothetical protein LSAT_V11C400224270 [Lactuca sativa]